MIALLCIVFTVFGQENDQTLKRVATLETLVNMPSLASRINEIEPAINSGEEAQDSRSLRGPKIAVVPGKGNQRDVLSENPQELR